MSVIKGKSIDFAGAWNGVPAIRYNKSNGLYVLRVPDMYKALNSSDGSEIGSECVWISGEDLWRLIHFDKWYENGVVALSTEQGDLDDTTYLGISYVQARWYLSKHVMDEARRMCGRFGFSQWVILKKRVRRGGRVPGCIGGGTRISEAERERLCGLVENYKRIVDNCCRHDWAEEYVELERDITRYKGARVESRKKIIERFTEIRKKWIEENE